MCQMPKCRLEDVDPDGSVHELMNSCSLRYKHCLSSVVLCHSVIVWQWFVAQWSSGLPDLTVCALRQAKYSLAGIICCCCPFLECLPNASSTLSVSTKEAPQQSTALLTCHTATVMLQRPKSNVISLEFKSEMD
eukprot:GHRR01032284.1.p1 GENE.GHRR01032284.1~~GHRR01032284.1.p1  ORF type:complete len:134 (-),score=15.50 GHRR01032284.1:1282-1683(-)